MKEYIEQTPSELLNLLLDGELEESQESTLFSSLSESGELRNELHELLAIRESVKNDIEAFTPPVEATKGVFAQLGFKPAVIPSPTPIMGSAFMNMSRKFIVPVVAAIMASLFTGLFISNIYENKIAQMKSNVPLVASMENESGSRQNAIAGNDNTPAVTNKTTRSGNSNIAGMSNANHKTGNVITGNSKNINTVEIEEPVQQPVETPGQIYSSVYPGKSYKAGLNYIPGTLSPLDRTMDDSPLALNIKQDRTPTLVEVSSVVAKSTPVFSNISFGIYIFHTGNLHVGLEAGREPFSQIYLNKDKNQTAPYELQQNPPSFFFGITGKYDFTNLEITKGLYPYIQGFVGGDEFGALGKSVAGLQYNITESIGLQTGLEGSMLFYQNQNVSYTSTKVGLKCGMIVKF